MVCLSAVHRIQFLTYISSLCFRRHCSLMEPFFDKNWKTKEQKQTPCIWQEQWPHQNATSHFYHLHKFNAQQKVKMLAQLLEGNIMLKQQVLNNLLTYKETCTDLVMGFLTIGESILAFPFFFFWESAKLVGTTGFHQVEQRSNCGIPLQEWMSHIKHQTQN